MRKWQTNKTYCSILQHFWFCNCMMKHNPCVKKWPSFCCNRIKQKIKDTSRQLVTMVTLPVVSGRLRSVTDKVLLCRDKCPQSSGGFKWFGSISAFRYINCCTELRVNKGNCVKSLKKNETQHWEINHYIILMSNPHSILGQPIL